MSWVPPVKDDKALYEFEEGLHSGPFFVRRTYAGDSNPQKKRRPLGRLVGFVFDTAPALQLGRLGHGLAFGRERAIVDAATQAVKLHE